MRPGPSRCMMGPHGRLIDWRLIYFVKGWSPLFSELSSPSEVLFPLSPNERGTPVALEAILNEVGQLHQVGDRLEGLAEHHPPISEELLTIAGNVRGVAILLAVLVATKLHGSDGHTLTPQKKAV
jgi:hypothetical protein